MQAGVCAMHARPAEGRLNQGGCREGVAEAEEAEQEAGAEDAQGAARRETGGSQAQSSVRRLTREASALEWRTTKSKPNADREARLERGLSGGAGAKERRHGWRDRSARRQDEGAQCVPRNES